MLRDRRLLWILGLTSIPFFMVALDTTIVVTALPTIHRDLGASLATLEWTVNAYTLAFAAGIITAAALGDRFGRRLIFVLGLALFTAASAACALAPSADLLIAARAVQGIGAALIMPLSLTILTAAFPPERRGTIVGLWGGIGGLAVALGPVIGGAVTQGFDWHWIFWVNVPIGLFGAVFSLTRLPESRGPATTLDPLGVVLSAGGSTAIVYGLVRASEIGWSSLEAIAIVAAGVALFALFVLWEARAAAPMLPLRLFRSRSFTAGAATAFLQAGALTSAAFLAAQYFQIALRYSPLDAGLRFLPWTMTPMFVAPIAGALSDRIGRRRVLATGMALQGIGLAAIAALGTLDVSYVTLVVPFIVAGVGVSMAIPTSSTAMLSAVAPSDIGKAAGVNSTVQRVGSAFAIAAAIAVFSTSGSLSSPSAFVSGFGPALGFSAGLSLIGAVTALAVSSRVAARPAVTQPVAVAAD
jgi:EmrB/QacA subfamily drug resistance transporter